MAAEDMLASVGAASDETEFYTPMPPGYQPGRTRYVFVFGTVMSGLGKGIFSSSLAKVLQDKGLSVAPIKLEGYLNRDSGTLNPFRHGEVFVLDDGTECDMDLGTFAARYVVTQDPKQKLAGYSAAHREAITSGRIMRGMTREQVIMAVGYPVSSENPMLESNIWRLWRDSFNEFQVHFDDQGRVKEISTDPMTRNLVVKE